MYGSTSFLSFRPMSCSPEVVSLRLRVDSPGVGSRFARGLKISCFFFLLDLGIKRIKSLNIFFSDRSYRPRKDEVGKLSPLINHLPTRIDSYIHPRAMCKLTTRGFVALQVCSHDEAYNVSLIGNTKIHYVCFFFARFHPR